MRVCPQCQQSYPDEFTLCPRDGVLLAPPQSSTESQLAAGLARRYRIIRRLGAGGMGTVFLAEQVAVGNRRVALKVLLRKFLDDSEFLVRFHNEAASTGKIHHPNVVTIYESGQSDDGTPYIAMEYLEGQTLREMLEARGVLPVSETVEILQQVARGLNAAHKLGIVHRDLKPDNIFMTHGDEGDLIVKVVDFGIAKLRESATHTIPGTVLGTPAYMSFEQASGMRGDELDARSDVYSLGIVAYEMLTGRLPFHSDTPLGYVRKHLMEQPPTFRAIRPDLPALPEVEKAVFKALSKERKARYSSALEFASALAGAILPNTERIPAQSGQPQTLGPTRKRSSQVWIVGLVLLVAVVAGLGAIWYFTRSPRQPTTQAQAEVSLVPGTARLNPKDGLKYAWIPPGTFIMGCSPGDNECDESEKPAHQVTLTKGFWMGQTEVTVGAYKRFARETGRGMPPEPVFGKAFNSGWANNAMPIVNVTWDDGTVYCSWAGGRLPTEAEWEYAARAGNTAARYGPLEEIAWCLDNSGNARIDSERILRNQKEALDKANSSEELNKIFQIEENRYRDNGTRMHEVAQKRPNKFGLFDTLGNVVEMVSDYYYKGYYQSSPGLDPQGPFSGEDRMYRGGAFLFPASDLRVSKRSHSSQKSKGSPASGFRCVRGVLP